jgi:predicted ATPase
MKYFFANYPNDYKKENLKDGLFFVRDNWNDYGFYTLFHTFLVINKVVTEISQVNISFKGASLDGENIGDTYNYLVSKNAVGKTIGKFPDDVFLLGPLQYYEDIQSLIIDEQTRKGIYEDTNDLAFNDKIFTAVKDMDVITDSFFRGSSISTIRQLHRYSHGGAKFVNFDWIVNLSGNLSNPINLNLEIKNDENAMLPTNTFALIGSNGIGKTSLLRDIVVAAAKYENSVESVFIPKGQITFYGKNGADVIDAIYRLVFVSFSSFDEFDEEFINIFTNNKNFSIVGNRDVNNINQVNSPEKVGKELGNKVLDIFSNVDLKKVFLRVMNNFQWDIDLLKFTHNLTFVKKDDLDFNKKILAMSSGQKIILIMLVNLVISSGENSLFLIDEPELYLHAPYSLALIKSINEIAEQTNSACIIATHSAVTLQEIRRKNVFLITKSLRGDKKIDNPKTQTFGTNTQTINDEVFGLDIRSTGYYAILKKIVQESPEKIPELIQTGDLGSDALMYLEIIRGSN